MKTRILNAKVGLLQKSTLNNINRKIKNAINKLKERDELVKVSYEIGEYEFEVIKAYLAQYKITGRYNKADVRAFANTTKWHMAEMEIDKNGVTIIEHRNLGEDVIWKLIKFPESVFEYTEEKYNKEEEII